MADPILMGLDARDFEELVNVAVGDAEQLFMEFCIRQENVLLRDSQTAIKEPAPDDIFSGMATRP